MFNQGFYLVKLQLFELINLQECPNGSVNEDTFKEIYEKFFPYGSKHYYSIHIREVPLKFPYNSKILKKNFGVI